MWGVTARVARAHGYTGAMRDLPQSLARSIYKGSYWALAGCDAVPDGIRYDLFDAAVNSGPEQSIKFLQQAIGADADGQLGPQTLLLVGSMPIDKVRRRFNGVRQHFMHGLPNWQANSGGWAERIAANLLRD